jgi:NAD(P)-dependent dehydrogenase (short-subunit alcohol dehydrogenase family)
MPKIVIVGSGPGLAKSVAGRFGAEGWRVVMMARNGERLEAEAAELQGRGVDAVPVVCDVRDTGKLDALIRAESEDGGIDLLNHNAAIIRPNTPILDTSIEDIESDIAINLTAGIVAARAAMPGMRERGSGTILFSGGHLCFDPWPIMLTLGVGKAGLRNAAGALAKDPACKDLRIAYVNIHALIAEEVNDEIAELYWHIQNRPAAEHEWDMHYEKPYEIPPDMAP